MAVTDPIGDMLTRIRNGLLVGKASIDVPSSKARFAVLEVLKREGFIESFELVERPVRNDIRVHLKYGPYGERVIAGIERVSKPGCRIYKRYAELRPVLGGLGIHIVSTPKGMLSDREAREARVGGELVCKVW